MPFLEARAHLQSFETKMEFIRPKLTETWPFEIWIFKKINRKNCKAYRRERVKKKMVENMAIFLKILFFFTFSLFLRQVALINLIVPNLLKFPSKFALFVNHFTSLGHQFPANTASH